jgi:nucleotide-binding universal stress UspA family protein
VFQRILVPLDGSELAERALSVGSRIARASGSTLVLLRVVVSPDDIALSYRGPATDMAHIVERDRAEARAYLQSIARREDLKGIEVTQLVVEGNPAQTILTETRTSESDLIVMCSHGDTGFKRWVFGSVSLHVVRHSSVPVFVLRPGADGTVTLAQATAGPIRILVPLDGSELAEEILAPAIALTKALSAPHSGVLHLASIIPFFTAETADEMDQVVNAAQKYLASLEQQLLQREDAAGLTVTSSITVLADVAHALVEVAETGKGMEQTAGFTGCDAIAMSTHGRSGIAHWMMGSVTERVLAATKLPMLIVRPQQIRVKQQKAREEKHVEETSIGDEAEFPSWIGLL